MARKQQVADYHLIFELEGPGSIVKDAYHIGTMRKKYNFELYNYSKDADIKNKPKSTQY